MLSLLIPTTVSLWQKGVTQQDMKVPYGLAIHGDNLYVTDTELHVIFQFKTEHQFSLVTMQGNRGSQTAEFNCPLNLTVSTNGDVYVADCNNCRVQILNSSLQHLRNLTEQLTEYPPYIKVTVDEVYVLCYDNPCVHDSLTRERNYALWFQEVMRRK